MKTSVCAARHRRARWIIKAELPVRDRNTRTVRPTQCHPSSRVRTETTSHFREALHCVKPGASLNWNSDDMSSPGEVFYHQYRRHREAGEQGTAGDPALLGPEDPRDDAR